MYNAGLGFGTRINETFLTQNMVIDESILEKLIFPKPGTGTKLCKSTVVVVVLSTESQVKYCRE
jgi:hypothetical protein